MTTIDPSSRFQIRRIGELQQPGSCYVCGNGMCDDGYVDFGTFVDYHGSFYVCLTCAKQVAETIGWFSPDEVNTTQALMEELKSTNETLTKELEHARPIVNAITELAAVGLSGPALNALVEDASEQRDDTTESDSGQHDGEPDAKESDNRSGRTDASGTTKRHFTIDA